MTAAMELSSVAELAPKPDHNRYDKCTSSETLSTCASSELSAFGTSAAEEADAVWGADDMDEVQSVDEEEDLASVEYHLEAMNAAAADLNNAQECLKARTKQRHSQISFWAVLSARMARAVGSKHLTKAAPYFEARRKSQALQEEVEAASRRFMCARNAGHSEATLAKLAQEHSAALAKYLDVQRSLEHVREKNKISSKHSDVLEEFYAAEEEHRAELQEANLAVEQLARHVDLAKVQYQTAMRSLEDLSERVHQRRSSGASRPSSMMSSDGPEETFPDSPSSGLSEATDVLESPSSAGGNAGGDFQLDADINHDDSRHDTQLGPEAEQPDCAAEKVGAAEDDSVQEHSLPPRREEPKDEVP